MKICSVCSVSKHQNGFYVDKTRIDGFASTCKECSKLRARRWAKENKERINKRNNEWQKKNKHRVYQYNLKTDYGMQYGEYDKLYENQGGKCLVCGDSKLHRELVVDHSHQTGRVRGLLCKKCNTGIGMLKENPIYLHRAGDYLLGYPVKNEIFLESYEAIND